MSITQPDAAFPIQAGSRAADVSLLRRSGRGLRMFVRRSPMSAVWGCIAAGIVIMAIAAPLLAL
jgi:hypothetical protein